MAAAENEKKVAIVTGATSGIGLHTAIKLASNGYRVYATTRALKNQSELMKEEKGLKGNIIVAEVNPGLPTAREQIEKIVQQSGRVDLLVNNAGTGLIGAVERLSEEDMQAVLGANLMGPIRVIQGVLPAMRAARSGRIINVSSIGSVITVPSLGLYCASKAALDQITTALVDEVAGFGVKVISVNPGTTATSFSDSTNIANRPLEPNPYDQLEKGSKAGMAQQALDQ